MTVMSIIIASAGVTWGFVHVVVTARAPITRTEVFSTLYAVMVHRRRPMTSQRRILDQQQQRDRRGSQSVQGACGHCRSRKAGAS